MFNQIPFPTVIGDFASALIGIEIKIVKISIKFKKDFLVILFLHIPLYN